MEKLTGVWQVDNYLIKVTNLTHSLLGTSDFLDYISLLSIFLLKKWIGEILARFLRKIYKINH